MNDKYVKGSFENQYIMFFEIIKYFDMSLIFALLFQIPYTMEPNICKGTRNDFSYFVDMALQNRMPWKTLASLLTDLAPTLNETREMSESYYRSLKP